MMDKVAVVLGTNDEKPWHVVTVSLHGDLSVSLGPIEAEELAINLSQVAKECREMNEYLEGK